MIWMTRFNKMMMTVSRPKGLAHIPNLAKTVNSIFSSQSKSVIVPSVKYLNSERNNTSIIISKLRVGSQLMPRNRPAKMFNNSRYKSTDVKGKEISSTSEDDKKKKGSFKEVIELLRLTKSELPTLGWALLFLCCSSAVSMLFPSIMGKIIDTAKSPEGEGRDEVVANFAIPKTIEFFSHEIPINTFYAGLIVIFAIGSCANFGRILLLRKVGERIMAKLRVDIEKNIFYQSSGFWDKHKSGDLISRLVNDSTVVTRSVTQNISDGMRSTISGFVGVGMMLTISVKLTGYMFMIFPVLIFIALVFGKRIKRVSKEIQQQLGNLTKVSEEQFSFVKTIQSFNNEAFEVSKFQKEVKKLFDLSVYEGKLNGFFYSGNGFIGNTFLVFLLSCGVWMVRQGELTIGELSSYLMYTIYSASSVYSLSNFYSELMKGVGASERVFELLKLKPEIDPYVGKKACVDGDIEFKNIKFHYPTRPNHQVFNNLNLTIKKGDHVCLVGPSGCGKSTVTQLLLRYYDSNEGKIVINGHDLSELSLANFREQVGIVQQEPMLFSGTLKENIAYGRRDASDKDIKKACDLANCTTFINNFSDRLNTSIGAKGTQLSGGQKQRIALARTLLLAAQVPDNVKEKLKNENIFDEEGNVLLGPSVLILDEATSALDAHSEEAIKKTLELRHAAGLTTISIAHRLSTIKMSNRVVVFNQSGEVAADGQFTEMISDKFSKLNQLLNKSNKGKDTEVELTKKIKEKEEEVEEKEKEKEKAGDAQKNNTLG